MTLDNLMNCSLLLCIGYISTFSNTVFAFNYQVHHLYLYLQLSINFSSVLYLSTSNDMSVLEFMPNITSSMLLSINFVELFIARLNI